MLSPPGFEAVVALAASAVRHAGWWLDWQTRVRAGQGCRPVQ